MSTIETGLTTIILDENELRELQNDLNKIHPEEELSQISMDITEI